MKWSASSAPCMPTGRRPLHMILAWQGKKRGRTDMDTHCFWRQKRAWRDPETGDGTTIFLGYTSNMISSGLRGIFRYLVQHRHVSCVVTTAGGIEQDFIKCLGVTSLSPHSADT